jgi:hypothetical protein
MNRITDPAKASSPTGWISGRIPAEQTRKIV